MSDTGHDDQFFPARSDTGSSEPNYKEIECICGPYVARVRLTNTNEFLDIVEIRVDADFRSTEQRIHNPGFHDVTDLYEEKNDE